MLKKGKDLTPRQRKEVLSAFVYRWTKDNPQRENVWAGSDGQPTIPLISDDEWLEQHAFHFLKDGSRLMRNRHYCELAYMADGE